MQRRIEAEENLKQYVSGTDKVCKVGGAVETLHYVMRCNFLVGVYHV